MPAPARPARPSPATTPRTLTAAGTASARPGQCLIAPPDRRAQSALARRSRPVTPVSSSNMLPRKALTCATDSTGTRSAAISIASGRPSSAGRSPRRPQRCPGRPQIRGDTWWPGQRTGAQPHRHPSPREPGPFPYSPWPAAVPAISSRPRRAPAHGSSLPASAPGRRPAEPVPGRRTLDQVLARIQAHQQPRGRNASASVSSSGRPGSSVTPMTAATCGTTRSGCRRSASSTNHAPSGNPASAKASSRNASRDLPIPRPAQSKRTGGMHQPTQLAELTFATDETIRLYRQNAGLARTRQA